MLDDEMNTMPAASEPMTDDVVEAPAEEAAPEAAPEEAESAPAEESAM